MTQNKKKNNKKITKNAKPLSNVSPVQYNPRRQCNLFVVRVDCCHLW